MSQPQILCSDALLDGREADRHDSLESLHARTEDPCLYPIQYVAVFAHKINTIRS